MEHRGWCAHATALSHPSALFLRSHIFAQYKYAACATLDDAVTCARCGAGAGGAAASPLSLSHLSPTVQRVKNAFSPMTTAASGDLSATTHKDNSNQAGRSHSSNGALGHVAATNDVGKLQEALRARESQLETQASQLADLAAALRSLQVLALRPTASHSAPFLLIRARS